MISRGFAGARRVHHVVARENHLSCLGSFGKNIDRKRREEDRAGGDFTSSQLPVIQRRYISITRRSENSVLVAGLGIAASALAARYGLQAYNQWQVGAVSPCLPFSVELRGGTRTISDTPLYA